MTVVVAGGGVAGLVAARELAVAGHDVVLLEAGAHVGGTVASAQVGGLRVDVGAESFATRTPAVADLLDEVGLGDDVVVPAAGGAWLHAAGRTVPLPRAAVLGIPVSPWAADVRRVVGVVGAARASLDRVLPARVGTSDPHATLGDVVGARMGRRTLERLVAPVVQGVHSAHPDVLAADVVPGLAEAVRRRGGLAAAVAAMRAAAPAGSAVAGVRGGLHRLVVALVDDLARRGVEVRTGCRVASLGRAGQRWTVRTDDGDLAAEGVVVALPGPDAAALLGPVLGELPVEPPAQHRVDLVTLVLDAPALDGTPRGTGVLVAPGGRVLAKALTHATAKWGWLAQAAGPGRHVVRLSYGSADGAPRLPRDVVGVALHDASDLLGVPLSRAHVVDAHRVTWTSGLPRTAPGQRAAVARVREALAATGRLAVCGAWVAGTGLASVVPDARAAARSLAR